MKLPTPSKKNAFALTLYTLMVGGLLVYLDSITVQGTAQNSLLDTQENLTGLAAIASTFGFLWLFLAGLVVLAMYTFLIPKKTPLLKTPTHSLLLFYFIAILWLATLFTIDVLLFTFFLTIPPPTLSQETGTIIGTLISIAITLGTNTLGVVFILHYFKTSLKKLLATSPKKILGHIVLGIGGYIGFFPIFLIIAGINVALLTALGFELIPQPIIELTLLNDNFLVTILLFVAVVLFAPFFEEIIMRGLIFRGLYKKFSPWVAIIISGLIFGAFHFNFFSLIPITAVGIMLAWLYRKSGSLVPGMVAHALFNIVNFSLLELLT